MAKDHQHIEGSTSDPVPRGTNEALVACSTWNVNLDFVTETEIPIRNLLQSEPQLRTQPMATRYLYRYAVILRLLCLFASIMLDIDQSCRITMSSGSTHSRLLDFELESPGLSSSIRTVDPSRSSTTF